MQEWLDLVIKSVPIIGTRLLSAAKGLFITYVVSQKAPELLPKLTIPLALADSGYCSSTMLVTQTISDVRPYLALNDTRSVAEYYASGMILEGLVTPAISTAIFEIVALVLGLDSDVKKFIALCGFLLSARQMGMLTRQMMTALGVAPLSFVTMLLEVGLCFGLSWWLDANLALLGVFIALCGSSSFKLLLDSIYLAYSKKVFCMPRGERVWEEMKNRVKQGGFVSLQTLLELLVFLWGLPLLAHWNGPTASTALQIALSTEALTNPLSNMARGMQLQTAEQIGNPQRMKASAHRAALTTTVLTLIPLGVFLAVPREITGIFTQNKAVLDSSEKVMRFVAGGQALYNVREIQEAVVRTLPPKNTECALGVSLMSAVIFFGLTIPLTLTGIIGFDSAAGIFTALMAFSLLLFLPRYLASTTNSQCIKRVGIFKDTGTDTDAQRIPLVVRPPENALQLL